MNVRELFLFVISALVHEAGHILCAYFLHIPFSNLKIKMCGAVMTFDFSKTTYLREMCVHLAGAAFGITTAVFALLLFGDGATYFAGVSIWLAVLNLMPIEGFDGGGALLCVLSMLVSSDIAWRVCRAVSIAAVIFLWTAVIRTELRIRAGITILLFAVYMLVFVFERVFEK